MTFNNNSSGAEIVDALLKKSAINQGCKFRQDRNRPTLYNVLMANNGYSKLSFFDRLSASKTKKEPAVLSSIL